MPVPYRLIILALLSIFGSYPALCQNPLAKQGVLDLRQLRAEELDSIKIEGEWRFYWQQLLDPADLAQSEVSYPFSFQQAPKDWIFYEVDGEKLGFYGYATLAIKILLPDIEDELALRIQPIVMAGRVFVNGKLVFESGKIGEQSEQAGHRFDQIILPIGKNLSELDLIVQISNHQVTRSAYAAIEIGTLSNMMASEINYYGKTLFLIGGIFLMAIYHLCLFALRREDRSNLFFSGVCIANGLFIYVASGTAAFHFPNISSESMWDLFFLFWFSGSPFFAFFVASIFPRQFNPKLAYMVLIVSLVTIVCLGFYRTEQIQHIPKVHHFLNFFLFFYTCIVCIRAYRQKENGPLLFIFAFSIYFAGIVNDMLVTKGLMKGQLLSASGLFQFLFFQSLLLSRRFSNAFRQLELAEAKIRILNEGLEAKVLQKTRQIRAILNHIKQGIFTLHVDAANKIRLSEDYASYLESILDESDLANKEFCQTILDRSDLSSDQKSVIINSIAAAIGEDEIGFIANKGNLASEFRIFSSGMVKILEVEWEPMLNSHEKVEQILVSMKDVTRLRQLQAKSMEQQIELEYISEIVNTTAEQFAKFMKMAFTLVDENERLIRHNTSKNIEAIKILFINMHTIKGAARSYQFHKISGILHDSEQQYADLLRKPNIPWNQLQLLHDIHKVRDCLKHYDFINSSKLGRKRNDNQIELNRKMFEEKVKALNLIDTSLLAVKEREIIEDTRKAFNAAFYNSSTEVLKEIFSASERIARDLAKEKPMIKIEDPGIAFNQEAQELLSQIFNHLIRNSLDHGIETAAERIAKGKAPTGLLQLSLNQFSEGWLELKYRDDGRGLNLMRLKQIGIEKGLLQPELDYSNEELANLVFENGLSTSNSLTEISGRGVGMDAVKKYLERSGASIAIQLISAPQEGYCDFIFSIKIPSRLFTYTA